MARTTGTITTSSSTITAANTLAESVAMVSVNGTYAGVTINFEASNDGGANYYAIAGIRTSNGSVESSVTLSSNSSLFWAIIISGAVTHFRVRTTAYTSGTANIIIDTGDWQSVGAINTTSSNVAVTSALPTGTNSIGSVTISTALPTGTNTIGNVDVVTLPTVAISSQGGVVVLNRASAAVTANGNSSTLDVNSVSSLGVGINITATSGSSTPTIDFYLDSLGADSVWYPVWSTAIQTAIGSIFASIGKGMQHSVEFGSSIRLRWVVSGSSPSFTFSASIIGK